MIDYLSLTIVVIAATWVVIGAGALIADAARSKSPPKNRRVSREPWSLRRRRFLRQVRAARPGALALLLAGPAHAGDGCLIHESDCPGRWHRMHLGMGHISCWCDPAPETVEPVGAPPPKEAVAVQVTQGLFGCSAVPGGNHGGDHYAGADLAAHAWSGSTPAQAPAPAPAPPWKPAALALLLLLAGWYARMRRRPLPEMVGSHICNACGYRGLDFWYDCNPDNLPPLAVKADGEPVRCSMGAVMTGEPGAVRCTRCKSRDVVLGPEVPLPRRSIRAALRGLPVLLCALLSGCTFPRWGSGYYGAALGIVTAALLIGAWLRRKSGAVIAVDCIACRAVFAYGKRPAVKHTCPRRKTTLAEQSALARVQTFATGIDRAPSVMIREERVRELLAYARQIRWLTPGPKEVDRDAE